MWCVPSSIRMWYGLGITDTSAACTHPVVPFGRTGRYTWTQPGCSLLTRNTCCTVDDGTVGSTSHGLGRVMVGCVAFGESKTASCGTVARAVRDSTDAGAGCVVADAFGGVVMTCFPSDVPLSPPHAARPSASTSTSAASQ